jgi:hypothetical protein
MKYLLSAQKTILKKIEGINIDKHSRNNSEVETSAKS